MSRKLRDKTIENLHVMKAYFDKLADHLKSVSKRKKIIYIPNPGNFGDGLIRYGTKLLLQDYGIKNYELNLGYSRVKYQLFPLIVKKHRYHFVYGGGGAWANSYGFGCDIANILAKHTDELTVLPSTFELDRLPNRGRLYRRDEFESKERAPMSVFCPDMAFYVACRDGASQMHYAVKDRAPTGVLLRTDRESRFGDAIKSVKSVDISLEGDHMSNADMFLRRVAGYEKVYTDRLHVAIAACIVGTEAYLVGNNYFKNRAIFNSAIAPYFPHVTLLSDDFSLDDLPKV